MGTSAGMILAAALLLLPAPVLADPNPGPEDPADRGLRWKNAAVIGGIGIAVGIYGANGWWKDGFSGSFRTVDEGGFESLGNDPGRALRLGMWTSLGVMTGVEVVDGFSKKFRFSMEDAVAIAALWLNRRNRLRCAIIGA